MGMFYNGNDLDTTSKAELGHELVYKVVEEVMREKTFEDRFSIFDKGNLEAGAQIEEIEVGNLEPEQFDPSGAGVLDKKELQMKAIYHKVSRDVTYTTTASDKQIKRGLLNKNAIARVGAKIVHELDEDDGIGKYESFLQLLKDIALDQKNMVVADLNDNSANIDAIVKAIKVIGKKMTFPNVNYNFLGFKKEFCDFSDLVLIIDTSLEAILDVDSLATAFHMEKKSLLDNIIVIDEMPDIKYTTEACNEVAQVEIGEQKPLLINKLALGGNKTVSGKAKFFVLSKEAIFRTMDRDMEMARNQKGRFNNYFLHCDDMLSYSPLRNAMVFVD